LEAGSTQLGVLEKSLAPYLSSGHDPESLLTARRQALVDAQAEVKKLEQETLAAEGALRTLTTRKLQQEGDERVLASQRDAALAQAERETLAARENLELPPTHALPTLSELEVTLLELGQKQTQHAALMQREETIRDARNQAERQAVAVRADLEARERVLQEVRQKLQQAEQELNQTRAALQAAITQSQLSDIGADGEGLKERLEAASTQLNLLREQRIGLEKEITELERRCAEKEQEEEKLRAAETDARLAADLHKLLGAEFTDFLSQGAVEALMRDASVHLQRLTHGRYSFDIAYKRRAIELQIIDQEDHRRARPTHSLSGGETFLASLAIALALSQSFREIATGKAAKTSTECLILDEGFGTLDREGLQLVTETLQELRGEEGRMVGIITHVEEVAAAMPMRIDVRKGNRTSTITVSG
jgi:exonuclease SbcC